MWCAKTNPLYPEVKNPIRDALQVMLWKEVKIPEYVSGHDFSNLTDEELDELQTLCSQYAEPNWATGIGIMDAACLLVNEAVGNANIYEGDL